MRLFLGELTACDTVISSNDALREFRVFQSPEAKKTILELPVISAVDVILTITYYNQVWVLDIDINRRDHSGTSFVRVETFDL